MEIKYINTKNRNVLSVELRSRKSKQTKQDIDNYWLFHESLYKTITGKDYNWVRANYPCFGEESVREEYQECSGVVTMRTWDRIVHIFVPMTEEGDKITKWILEQPYLKSRKLKRCSFYDRGVSTYFRERDAKFKENTVKRLGRDIYQEMYENEQTNPDT